MIGLYRFWIEFFVVSAVFGDRVAKSCERSWIGRERHRNEMVNLAVDLICLLRGAHWAVRPDLRISAGMAADSRAALIVRQGWVELEATWMDIQVLGFEISALGLCQLAKGISENGLEHLTVGKVTLTPDSVDGQYWTCLADALTPPAARPRYLVVA